jgi:ribosome biogenesis GTPase A
LNKADLVSKKVIEKVKKEYSKIAPTVVVSSRNKKGLNELRSKIYQIGGKVSEDSNIVVGVLGYPNVGKSSVINALAFKKKVAVSKTAGTTHGEQKIKITDRLKVYDSPGVIPLLKFDNLRIGLIGARNPNKLTNLEYVATEIISMFLKRNKKAIEEFYRLKISSKDPYEALFEIGKKKGHMKKGGEVEEQRTSTMIINDWQQGKLRL